MSHPDTHTRDVEVDSPDPAARPDVRRVTHASGSALVERHHDRVCVRGGHRWWFRADGTGRLVLEDRTAPGVPPWVRTVLYKLGARDIVY